MHIYLSKGTFFAIGNPLLDMSIEVDQAFLKKYGSNFYQILFLKIRLYVYNRHGLKENQIILASDEHNAL